MRHLRGLEGYAVSEDIAGRLRESIKACRAIDRSELLAEAADTIDRQNREVSVLIAECQRQKDLLVNGARLTDAERAAVADAADRYAEITPESAETVGTLRGLLERLGGER